MVWLKHQLEINHNFNFKNNNVCLYTWWKCQKIVESNIISHYKIIKKTQIFQLISLFSQIGVKKLQNPLFGIVYIHWHTHTHTHTHTHRSIKQIKIDMQ